MTKTVRLFVLLTALVLAAIAAFVASRFAAGLRLWREGERAAVIRRPHPAAPLSGQPARESHDPVQNIAPLATVSVSSVEESTLRAGAGVADGVADASEWVTREEMGGAWIRLTWDRAATVTEVALYDRRSLADNVLSGTLSFADGSTIAVPALPPNGDPWHVTFAPKTVHWVLFRIDRAEGRHAGLAEIMVFGTVNP
jgi:hypothetical protein